MKYITAQERDEMVCEAWRLYEEGEIDREEREGMILAAWMQAEQITAKEARKIIAAIREEREEYIESIEERQHASGMYAQKDLIDSYRRER